MHKKMLILYRRIFYVIGKASYCIKALRALMRSFSRGTKAVRYHELGRESMQRTLLISEKMVVEK